MSGSQHLPFAENVRRAVGNETQRAVLADVTHRVLDRREEAVRAIPTWEALRDRARHIKIETLANLDRYLLEFERCVSERGGHVHWADTADEACHYIRELARARGVSLVVKSKSMVTEEIGLNGRLAEAGIRVVETDLGEYIVQLAGERPAHIIVPALLKSRAEVGRLFAEKLGLPFTDDVQTLTAEARRRLRADFCLAGMGITGANFAVAESGTIVIVENEGNARLTCSMPRIHVVVMGLEKVIPRIEDLAVFLTLLPRSATGQPMTSYVSFLTGPRRSDELDGPDELHVVILDNGRTTLLADPELRDALRCIRCGACLNVCPVYRAIGGHPYGGVYAGPIGAVVGPFLDPKYAAPELPFASTLCGACGDICPVRIDIPALLVRLRGRLVAGEPGLEPLRGRRVHRLVMRLWAMVVSTPRRYRLAGRVVRSVLRLLSRGGVVRWLPGPFNGWRRVRDLPVPPRQSFRERWEREKAAEEVQ